jgi:hypothetical protein
MKNKFRLIFGYVKTSEFRVWNLALSERIESVLKFGVISSLGSLCAADNDGSSFYLALPISENVNCSATPGAVAAKTAQSALSINQINNLRRFETQFSAGAFLGNCLHRVQIESAQRGFEFMPTWLNFIMIQLWRARIYSVDIVCIEN